MIFEIRESLDYTGMESLNVWTDLHPLTPLFYAVLPGNRLIYASEIKSLISLLPEKIEINSDYLWKWLVGGPVRYTNETLFKGIYRIYGPGVFLFHKDKVEYKEKPPFLYKLDDHGMEWHVKDVSEYLLNACRKMSGESTLLGLSGGLDSRILACAMKYADVPFRTFTYGFDLCFEEAIIARQIAEVLKIQWSFFKISDLDYIERANVGIDFSNGESLYKHGVHDRMYEILSCRTENIVFGSALDLLIGDSYAYGNLTDFLKSTWIFNREQCSKLFRYGDFGIDIWGRSFDDKVNSFNNVLTEGAINYDTIRAFVFDTRVRQWYNANLIYSLRYMKVLLPTYDSQFLDAVSRVPYKYRKGDQFRVALLRYLDKWGVGNINYNATGVPANIDPEIAIMFEDVQRDIENTKEELWGDEGIYIPSYKYEIDLKACYRLHPEFVVFLLNAFEPLYSILREDYLLKLLAEHVGGKADHMRKLTQLASVGLMLKWAQNLIKNITITM